MKKLALLKNKWLSLITKYSDNETLIYNTFKQIKNCYNSSKRKYHNLNHIKDMLLEAEKLRRSMNDYDLVLFAIWFHDIVYDAKKGDNEERSADIAEKFLNKVNYNKEKIKKIKNLILKTKNHSNVDSNGDFDTKLFLDLDLLILGTNKEMYRIYAEKIRKEYSFVPDKIYGSGRIKILENFLSQEFIFRTETFRKIYEKIAKYNIKSEIEYHHVFIHR